MLSSGRNATWESEKGQSRGLAGRLKHWRSLHRGGQTIGLETEGRSQEQHRATNDIFVM